MNRSVLVVTPFFAPQNHAAVFRTYKLVKYLPQFGWTPLVLTVDRQYQFLEDPASLAALPGMEIIKAPYIEPTLRGMRMALGGRNRTFNALKPKYQHDGIANEKPTTAATYEYLLRRWFGNPDMYWTWARHAIAAGKKIISRRKIDVVLTSCFPYSSLEIGLELQKSGARWIADFRDPLGYDRRLSSAVPRVYKRQWNTVRTALHRADAVTVLSSAYTGIFHEVFGNGYADPIFIPTGMDEDGVGLIEESTSPSEPFLIFTGEYLPEYETTFLETFARALTKEVVRATGVKLLIVGNMFLNRGRLTQHLSRFGLTDFVKFVDQMPQSEVYKLILRSRAGVLIPGEKAFWWTNFAKMTDFIGLRKPVVAVVPDPSEARTALTRSRLGIFLDGTPEQKTATLIDFLLGKRQMAAPDQEECNRYTARRQVQSFVEVFESVAA